MKASSVIKGFGQTRSLTMVALLLSLVRVLPDELPAETIREDALVSTFSIVAFDPLTQELGIAVQSKFFGVGSVVPWAKAGVGAIATQSYANVTYGPNGLGYLESGLEAAAVIEKLTSEDAQSATRQVAVVDAHGGAASFTGEACHSWAGHVVGQHYAIQGNLLAGQKVVEAMDRAFRQTRGQPKRSLADALMAALAAGQAAGGDKRGRQSAALLVVREGGGYAGSNDRFIDLRVEDHPKLIAKVCGCGFASNPMPVEMNGSALRGTASRFASWPRL
ncbi:MAG: DUF1028 domain-containing protein [Verrucomicrobiota bacterium]|nr:DUF1028 domain-containing protein [Verrucomicrobiota bacterium]